jgi:hypothetical protein
LRSRPHDPDESSTTSRVSSVNIAICSLPSNILRMLLMLEIKVVVLVNCVIHVDEAQHRGVI